MREIKFRAWDVEGQFMKDVMNINGQKVMFADDTWDWYKRERIVMQYTGLKDRNGKDIYEGDIVRIIETGFDNVNDIDYFEQWLVNEGVISHEIDEDGYISYEYSRVKDKVVMDRFPRYWLKNETFGYEGEDLIEPDRTEVIGNIYENPELLEQKDSDN